MFRITLKSARVNAGYSQKEASKLLGVSNKTLWKWEQELSSPNAKQVAMICELYKLPYDAIKFF